MIGLSLFLPHLCQTIRDLIWRILVAWNPDQFNIRKALFLFLNFSNNRFDSYGMGRPTPFGGFIHTWRPTGNWPTAVVPPRPTWLDFSTKILRICDDFYLPGALTLLFEFEQRPFGRVGFTHVIIQETFLVCSPKVKIWATMVINKETPTPMLCIWSV